MLNCYHITPFLSGFNFFWPPPSYGLGSSGIPLFLDPVFAFNGSAKCLLWSIDSNLTLCPPLQLGDGAKANGCGCEAFVAEAKPLLGPSIGGTELFRVE